MLQTALNTFSEFVKNDASDNGVLSEPRIGATIYVASAIVNILALALPFTILQIYDRVLPNASFDTLTALVTALVCIIVVDATLKFLRASLVNWSAAAFTHKLSMTALSKMLAARPSLHSRTMVSEHLERLTAINGLGGYLGGQSRLVAVDILFIPVFALIIILVGGPIFFVVLSLFAGFGYLALRRTRALNAAIAERETHDARKHDFIIEVLRTMQTVKSAAMEPLMMRRFERLQSSASMITKRIINLTGEAQTYSTMYASLSIIAIVSVGAVLVLNGRLTLGALACCMLLSSQLLQPLMRSLASWNEIQMAKHHRSRIAQVFGDEKDALTPDRDVKAAFRYGEKFNPQPIAFENVTVQHGDSPPLFEELNLDVAVGSLIAIKGADGSGRSSLLRVLMDDTPIVRGRVLIGGKSVDAGARHLVRYVGQTPTIFRGSLLDNLTLYGEISTNAALAASRIIGIDDEVNRMPLGYDTMLKSAAGRDLPASTAQRLSIARAIATMPSVIVLDEANTLLDLAGEQRFVAALKRLHGRITIIVATHRPSLIKLADEAYEISNRKLQRIGAARSDAKALAS